jgi:hypothetical protein
MRRQGGLPARISFHMKALEKHRKLVARRVRSHYRASFASANDAARKEWLRGKVDVVLANGESVDFRDAGVHYIGRGVEDAAVCVLARPNTVRVFFGSEVRLITHTHSVRKNSVSPERVPAVWTFSGKACSAN